MTPQERAEKICYELFCEHSRPPRTDMEKLQCKNSIPIIAAQISEAEMEAVIQAKEHWINVHDDINCSICHKRGYNLAKEQAAKICKQLTNELDEPTENVFSMKFKKAIKEMNGSVVSEECEERIRAMSSEGEK